MSYDSQDERQRFTNLYGQMTEEELHKIAEDAAHLTDMAREVLSAELERRGVRVETDIATSTEEFDSQELATVGQFRDLPEALLAKGRLDSAMGAISPSGSLPPSP